MIDHYTAETPSTRSTNLYCHPEQSEGPMYLNSLWTRSLASLRMANPNVRRELRLATHQRLLNARQFSHHLRNLLDRMRMRQTPGRRRHALQPHPIADRRRNRVDQIGRAQIAFFDHHRGA